MSVIRLKQGEEFSVNVQYTEADGVTPKSLAGVTILSLIRDTNFVVHAELSVTITNEALGQYSLTAPLGTNDWPAGMLLWDVNYNNGEIKETVAIEVLRTESLSNSHWTHEVAGPPGPSGPAGPAGPAGPTNILNDVNFRISSCTPGVWVENVVESSNFVIWLFERRYPQVFSYSNVRLIVELAIVGTPTLPLVLSGTLSSATESLPFSVTAVEGVNVIDLAFSSPVLVDSTSTTGDLNLALTDGGLYTGNIRLLKYIIF